MDEKGADGVVDGVKHTLSFAILLGSVGARMAKQNVATGQEGRHGIIDELGAIVVLKTLGNRVKLSLNMGNKINKLTIDFRFLAQRNGPAEMNEIIKDDQIIFVTHVANHWRSPDITVNESKGF